MMKYMTHQTQRQRFSSLSLLVAMLLMIVAPPPLVQAAAPIAGFGMALDFDGGNDYISIPSGINIANQSFTFEAWAKRGSIGNGHAIVGQGTNSTNQGLQFGFVAGDQFIFSFVNNAFGTSTTYTDNDWHHWTATYNAATKIRTIYQDGIQVAQASPLATHYQGSGELRIGQIGHTAGGDEFDGNLDEVRIWNTARTQAEISANMSKTLQGNEAGLIGYWQFDENTGTAAGDKTTNNNDGTLTNMDAADWVSSEIPITFTTNENTSLSATLSAYDADGDALTYSIVDDDGGAAVLDDNPSSTGAFTYTPADSGTRTFTYKVNDDLADSNVATVTVTVTSLVVDKIGDIEDGDYSTGENTLREAIANASAGDTITFDPSITGQTIILTNQLTIDKNLTIDGSGQKITVSGNNAVRVFVTSDGNTVTFDSLTIINAKSNDGGGILVKGNVIVKNCTFSGNVVTGNGGAIRLNNNGNRTLIIENSTFVNNSANRGGAIDNDWAGGTTIRNSTFVNNSATSEAGAIRSNNSLLTIENCTFSGNNKSTINSFGTKTFTLKNTILANNSDGTADCQNNATLGIVTNNLIESNSGCGTPVSTTDPLLSTLAENGGNTQTMALLPGSPAINAGDNATCLSTDQRGETRPKTAENPCDIGAYEVQLPDAPTNLTATTTSQTQINLTWSDNSSNEAGFKIERPTGTLITTTAVDATSYSDSGLSCGRTYSYSVKATNGAGDSTAITESATTSACTSILTVSKTGNGTINGTGINCGSDCQENIVINTNAILTATPDDGWLFSAWGGDCSGTNPTITITLDANKTCTPLFEEITCPTTNHLHVNKTASGKGTGCDWGNGFTDLQKALAEIAAGTFSVVKEIWVTKGTYKPTISTDRGATFQLLNGVAIYGGFAGNETQLSERNSSINTTTLSGDIGIAGDNSDNSYHVVTGSGTNTTAILDGFTISGGNANDGDTCPNACGGGIFNDHGSPTLKYLFVRNNTAILGGGVMNWQNSRPVINKTFISNNNATDGGGIMNDGSPPVISHVFVKDNTATNNGGGLLNRNNANPLLSHVNLNHNTATTGGGMLNENSNPVVSHSILSANTATDGAGMMNQNLSAPTISHVIISGNIASQSGGAILNDNSTPLITQSTLSGNSSGIVNRNSRPTVNNSILWNSGTAITDDATSQTTVNYSIVEGGWAGNGNKADDPLFVEVADATTIHTTVGAFHLVVGSPAIDAGNNDLIPLDLADAECFGEDGNKTEPVDLDFDGHERRFDGNGDGIDTVDMGAYEAFPSLSFYPLTVTITGNGSGTVNSNKAGITCGNDCNQDYLSGTEVLLIAKADAGSQFASWGGACNSTENKIIVEMTEAKSCEAQFYRAGVSLEGITLICDDCTINNAALETVAAQPVGPGDYVFPQGLVGFELSDMVNPQAHINIYFNNINYLDNFIYRKYGPVTPGDPNSADWYTFSNVTIGLDTLDGKSVVKASLTLSDGVFGDDTGIDGRIVDAGGIARAVVAPSTVVSTSIGCATEGNVSGSCHAGEQTFTNEIAVTENASVSRTTFEADVDNKGMISNSTIRPGATLTGGKLSGSITNEGNIADVNFVGIELSGGTLSGTITNNSKVGGVIRDVRLAAGATLKRGKVAGRIIGDPDDPPLITAAKILPGTYLSNVRLSPTVELPKNVVFGSGVILPSEPPTPAEFGLEPEDIAKLNAKTLGDLEPPIFRTFAASDVTQIPPEAFSALEAAQIAEMQKEALEGLTTEQFEQMPVETLGGLTSENMGGLPTEVLTEFTQKHLNALDVKEFKAMPSEDVSKLFTNLDAENITPKAAEKLLPPSWKLNLETGALTAPIGAKLFFQSSPSRRYSSSGTSSKNSANRGAFSLPKLPNLKAGFGVGGGGTSLMKNTERSLEEEYLTDFVLSQDENGILLVEGTGESAGILYTFIPDADNAIQVDTDKIPIGLSTSLGGFYTITTPDGIQYKVIPAPKNPVALSELFGGTEVVIGERGDVLVELPVKTRRGGARQVLIFDAFVEPAPEDICVELDTGETFCEFDNAPEHVQPGLHLPIGDKRSTRVGEKAKVVYPDGTAQTIRPTVLSPDIFIQEGMKFDGVERMLFKANGLFYAFYQGNHLWIPPNFEVKTETVEADGAIAPSITTNGKGGVTYTIAIDEPTQTRRGGARQILIFDLFIEPAPEELCVELETGETFCEFDNAAEHAQP